MPRDREITIDLDQPCRRCGEKGAARGSELCLACVAKRLERSLTMITWTEPRTLPVALTDAEVQARGTALAEAVAEHDRVEVEQAAVKTAMKETLARIEGRIGDLARVVRECEEERPVTVEVRVHADLSLVRVVRVDTGQVLEERKPSEKERTRAAGLAQGELVGRG